MSEKEERKRKKRTKFHPFILGRVASELLFEVFSFLPLESFLMVEATCKVWETLFAKDSFDILWCRIYRTFIYCQINRWNESLSSRYPLEGHDWGMNSWRKFKLSTAELVVLLESKKREKLSREELCYYLFRKHKITVLDPPTVLNHDDHDFYWVPPTGMKFVLKEGYYLDLKALLTKKNLLPPDKPHYHHWDDSFYLGENMYPKVQLHHFTDETLDDDFNEAGEITMTWHDKMDHEITFDVLTPWNEYDGTQETYVYLNCSYDVYTCVRVCTMLLGLFKTGDWLICHDDSDVELE